MFFPHDPLNSWDNGLILPPQIDNESDPIDDALNQLNAWQDNLNTQLELYNDFYKKLWQFAIDEQEITNANKPPVRGLCAAIMVIVRAIVDCLLTPLLKSMILINTTNNAVQESKLLKPLQISVLCFLTPIAMLVAASMHLIVAPVKSLGRCVGLFQATASTVQPKLISPKAL